MSKVILLSSVTQSLSHFLLMHFCSLALHFRRSYDTLLKQVSDEYFKEMHQSDFVKHFYDEAVEKRKEEEKKKNDAIEAALKRQQPQRVIKHLSEGYTFEVGNKAALEARPKRDKFKEPEPRQYLAKLPDMPFIDGYTGKGMHEVANRRQKVTKKPPPTYKRHLPLADEDVWRKFSQLSSAKGSQFQWPDRSVLAQTQAQQPPEIPAQLAALCMYSICMHVFITTLYRINGLLDC